MHTGAPNKTATSPDQFWQQRKDSQSATTLAPLYIMCTGTGSSELDRGLHAKDVRAAARRSCPRTCLVQCAHLLPAAPLAAQRARGERLLQVLGSKMRQYLF